MTAQTEQKNTGGENSYFDTLNGKVNNTTIIKKTEK